MAGFCWASVCNADPTLCQEWLCVLLFVGMPLLNLAALIRLAKIMTAGSAVCIQNPDAVCIQNPNVFTCSFTQIVSISSHLHLKGTLPVNDCILQLSLHVPVTRTEVGLVCSHEMTCPRLRDCKIFLKSSKKKYVFNVSLNSPSYYYSI